MQKQEQFAMWCAENLGHFVWKMSLWKLFSIRCIKQQFVLKSIDNMIPNYFAFIVLVFDNFESFYCW